MKVILAGYPKTGTKTIASALKTLDYNVYDFMENFWYLGKEWNTILTSGGTVDDFKQMYGDIDAVTDTPVYFFWEQIHQAFPDSLIILTIRDEQSWLKSWEKQMNMINSTIPSKMLYALSPSGWAYRKHFNACSAALFGFSIPYFWSRGLVNNMMMLNRYKMHNEYVLKHAPKDKLLVFDVRDGWEPLCKFLGKEVPDAPFPHKNVDGSYRNLMLKENEIMQRIHRHTLIAGALWLSVGSAAIFFVGRAIFKKYCTGVFAGFRNI